MWLYNLLRVSQGFLTIYYVFRLFSLFDQFSNQYFFVFLPLSFFSFNLCFQVVSPYNLLSLLQTETWLGLVQGSIIGSCLVSQEIRIQILLHPFQQNEYWLDTMNTDVNR